jgi:hypothetical protein
VRPCVTFRNKLFLYGEELLAPRTTTKLEDHPLSAVRDYLFSIFPATLLIIRMMTSRRMRWTGHVARLGEKTNGYRVLVGKPEGKRTLGRSRRRWEDIRMDLREIGWGGMDWIQGLVAGSCEHGNEPSGSIKCWEILE